MNGDALAVPPRTATGGRLAAPATIKRILVAHGLEPAPSRGKTMPWKTFFKAHFGAVNVGARAPVAPVARRERLGGLLNFYPRPAA